MYILLSNYWRTDCVCAREIKPPLGVFIYTDLWNNGCLPLSFVFLCEPEYMYFPWIDQMPSWSYWYFRPLLSIYCIFSPQTLLFIGTVIIGKDSGSKIPEGQKIPSKSNGRRVYYGFLFPSKLAFFGT